MTAAPTSIDELKQFADGYWGDNPKPVAFALGVGRYENGRCLDVHFPVVNMEEMMASAAVLEHVSGSVKKTVRFMSFPLKLTTRRSTPTDSPTPEALRNPQGFRPNQCYNKIRTLAEGDR